MSKSDPQPAVERLLVMMPSWFGDCLMATPTLRALRRRFPQAHLAAFVSEALAPLLDGLPELDEVITHQGGVTSRTGKSAFHAGRRLAKHRFDTAVLLPNSFRAAATARLARIGRRVGYDRDGRGVLLTDRLVARHDGKDYVPVPAIDYYLSLAHYLGAEPYDGDHRMEVATRPEDDARAAALLEPARGRPVVLLNPGAAKTVKRWPPQAFAQLAGMLHDQLGMAVAVSGAPDEREVLARVTVGAPCKVIDLPKAGLGVGLLKSVVKRCALVVTNDTGPRHLAAALEVPVVTLFGPTLPEWTETGFEWEKRVLSPSPDAPDAMRQITVGSVFEAARMLMQEVEAGRQDAAPDVPADAVPGGVGVV